MSFILDALKKSETDRQRQSGPSLFEVKVAPPRRALPVWAMAIAVLLAINVVVISWMLLRHAAAPRPAAAKAPAVEPAATPPRPAAARATPQAPVPELASGASAPSPAAGGTAAGAAQLPAAAPSAGPEPPAAAAAAVTPPAVPGAGAGPAAVSGRSPAAVDPSDYAPAVQPAATQGSGVSSGGLPLYPQVVATDGLPPLHLDLHVYAKNPKDRFVMINMHKLVDGDSLPNGVHVDAIRPDGVVLSYHGTQFLLPRD